MVSGVRARGFSLVEVLVALVVFSVMAALAYGGLNAVARTRTELAAREDAFHGLMRIVGTLDRDLREAVARPVLDGNGKPLPALLGTAGMIEFTRLGFANPQAEPRANLERVVYALDGKDLKRGRYAVLDRAPGSLPQLGTLRGEVSDFRLRYLDGANRWSDVWPSLLATDPNQPPRAIEWRITTPDYGEITQVIELPSPWPANGAPVGVSPGGAANPAPTPTTVPPVALPPPPGGSS